MLVSVIVKPSIKIFFTVKWASLPTALVLQLMGPFVHGCTHFLHNGVHDKHNLQAFGSLYHIVIVSSQLFKMAPQTHQLFSSSALQ